MERKRLRTDGPGRVGGRRQPFGHAGARTTVFSGKRGETLGRTAARIVRGTAGRIRRSGTELAVAVGRIAAARRGRRTPLETRDDLGKPRHRAGAEKLRGLPLDLLGLIRIGGRMIGDAKTSKPLHGGAVDRQIGHVEMVPVERRRIARLVRAEALDRLAVRLPYDDDRRRLAPDHRLEHLDGTAGLDEVTVQVGVRERTKDRGRAGLGVGKGIRWRHGDDRNVPVDRENRLGEPRLIEVDTQRHAGVLRFSLGDRQEALKLDIRVQLPALGVGRQTDLLCGRLAPLGEAGVLYGVRTLSAVGTGPVTGLETRDGKILRGCRPDRRRGVHGTRRPGARADRGPGHPRRR